MDASDASDTWDVACTTAGRCSCGPSGGWCGPQLWPAVMPLLFRALVQLALGAGGRAAEWGGVCEGVRCSGGCGRGRCGGSGLVGGFIKGRCNVVPSGCGPYLLRKHVGQAASGGNR